MKQYSDLVCGLEVEVTDGMYKGRTGKIASIDTLDPVRNTPQVMVHLGEKNRESNQPILHPFGFGLNKVDFLKVVGR